MYMALRIKYESWTYLRCPRCTTACQKWQGLTGYWRADCLLVARQWSSQSGLLWWSAQWCGVCRRTGQSHWPVGLTAQWLLWTCWDQPLLSPGIGERKCIWDMRIRECENNENTRTCEQVNSGNSTIWEHDSMVNAKNSYILGVKNTFDH